MRIVVARSGIDFGLLEEAKQLLDEIEYHESRREGYAAVCKRIALRLGVDNAGRWIESIEDPISRSGAILGLVQFMRPVAEVTCELPRYFRGC